MGRSMLKWHGRRKYRIRDTPYVRLEESPDTTMADKMKKQGFETKNLRNIWSSGCLARRAVINNARNGQSDVTPMSETGDAEQSSFVTISSEELHSDSGNQSEVCMMENEQSQHAMRNTFRRFSESSIASVAKMSAKWCKIRDSFVSARRSSCSLPEAADNACKWPRNEGVKADAAMLTSSKNSLERIKQTNSVHNRKRRWSLFSTGYVKLDNSDSSQSIAFGMEDAAHSTFIHERKKQEAGKRKYGGGLEDTAAAYNKPLGEKFVTNTSLGCIRKHPTCYKNEKVSKNPGMLKSKQSISKVNKMPVRMTACPNISSERNTRCVKTKRLTRNIRATRLPKVKRKDIYNVRTLSVKSSEGKVEVKISLELSDARNHRKISPTSSNSSRSGITNNYYLQSPLQTIDVTPVLPKRPLSRRSLFSGSSDLRETVTRGETEVTSYDEATCNDRSKVWTLNKTSTVKENCVHLSPHTAGAEGQLITPPNRKELTLSIAQVGNCRPRRLRKQRSDILMDK
ncbi:uncharacterized protein LOC126299194 [Schistocerca gregaria]|uniref:uncharacterized protein LOC126299194 n=1 Tax=Schistocerca gregaria TaxID=7010 RepID=UPI00211EF409|nr:uncharacterized protein LOC126299194 [Schistocerca gregaria]